MTGANLSQSAATTRSVFVYDPLDHPIDFLTERGVDVTLGTALYATGDRRPKWEPAEFIAAAAGHSALLGASGAKITREVLRQLPGLRCVSKIGIGFETIDVAAATELGVIVTNTPVEDEVDAVAEHTIALMLGLMKQLHVYGAHHIAAGRWRLPDHMSRNLHSATVGVIGLGHIGRAVARRLACFGPRLLGFDLNPTDVDGLVEPATLEALLAGSDVITLHASGRPPGEGPLLDRAKLALLPEGALIVNTARGNLVDQSAIVELLGTGRVGGFAADVFDPEPPAMGDPILSAPNVLLTPHCAAWNADLRQAMVDLAMENLWTALNGETPSHLVNPEVLSASKK